MRVQDRRPACWTPAHPFSYTSFMDANPLLALERACLALTMPLGEAILDFKDVRQLIDEIERCHRYRVALVGIARATICGGPHGPVPSPHMLYTVQRLQAELAKLQGKISRKELDMLLRGWGRILHWERYVQHRPKCPAWHPEPRLAANCNSQNVTVQRVRRHHPHHGAVPPYERLPIKRGVRPRLWDRHGDADIFFRSAGPNSTISGPLNLKCAIPELQRLPAPLLPRPPPRLALPLDLIAPPERRVPIS